MPMEKMLKKETLKDAYTKFICDKYLLERGHKLMLQVYGSNEIIEYNKKYDDYIVYDWVDTYDPNPIYILYIFKNWGGDVDVRS